MKTRYKIILVVLILCFLGGIAVWLYDECKIDSFEIDGIEMQTDGRMMYTPDDIRDKLGRGGLNELAPVIYFNSKFKKHVTIPFIDSYSVELKGLSGIKVHLYPSAIIGCTKFMGYYMYFDGDGMVVDSSLSLIEGIPVVGGLHCDSIVLYEEMPVSNKGIFNEIKALTMKIEKYKLPVLGFDFDDNHQVTLVMKDGSEIFLGRKDNYDTELAVLNSVLKSYSVKSYIDLSRYDGSKASIVASPMEDEEAGNPDEPLQQEEEGTEDEMEENVTETGESGENVTDNETTVENEQ